MADRKFVQQIQVPHANAERADVWLIEKGDED